MTSTIGTTASASQAAFAARARASWEQGIPTEARAAAASRMTVEEYRADRERGLRQTAETVALYAAHGASLDGSRGFASAADATSQARDAIDNLREHVASINGHAAHLDPANLKQFAGLFGQEWAEDYRKRLDGSLASAIDLLGVKQQQVAERFEVAGSLVRRTEDGGHALGAFVLEARGEGFAARIGSNGAVRTDGLALPRPPAGKPAIPALPLDVRA